MTFDLSRLGWDAHFASSYRRFDRPDHRPVRITQVDRGICSVLAADGAHRASIGGGLLAAACANPVRLPCAGDWAVLRSWPDERTTLEAILPRRTAVIRAGAGVEAVAQVLAANVDSIGVIASVDPEPDLGRIERLLALAWESGAQPLIILTKIDLAAHPDALVAEVAEVAPGVDVYAVSAATGQGMDSVRPWVASGRTLGLVGASGTGKSTLVNALVGMTVMGTQSIRRADGRGRHTTTYRALVPVPNGGAVLDTPGIRAVGLFDGVAGLDLTFPDVDRLAKECRFGDCSHGTEPGCRVQQALASGELAHRRLESWQRLGREIALEARRADVRLSTVERRGWKRRQSRVRGQ